MDLTIFLAQPALGHPRHREAICLTMANGYEASDRYSPVGIIDSAGVETQGSYREAQL